MPEEDRAYWNHFAHDVNNLAPECRATHAPTPVLPPVVPLAAAASQPAATGRRGGEGQRARAQAAAPAPPGLEAARRETLARQARVQEDLHLQRQQMDQAKLKMVRRRGQNQDQLR